MGWPFLKHSMTFSLRPDSGKIYKHHNSPDIYPNNTKLASDIELWQTLIPVLALSLKKLKSRDLRWKFFTEMEN